MRSTLVAAAAAAVLVTAGTAPALAMMIAPPNTLQRALTAPIVVVGKVASIEDDTVDAAPFPGSPKAAHKIAVIKIEDALVGAKGLTHIKVGFLPPPPAPPVNPNGPIGGGIRPIRPRIDLSLKADQAGCFFLKKHPTADFYVFDYMSQPLNASAENYKDELATTKKAIAAAADPLKALKAEKAEDRYIAAAAVVTKYRTPAERANGAPKEVAIPAEETKLIFAAILETDWTKFEAGVPHPNQLLGQTGVMVKGGFQPKPFTGQGDFNAQMKADFKKWIDGPGAKFVMKKFVAPVAEDK